MNTECDTIIIGAGLAGLVLAQKLKAKGERSLLIEKSRGLGGRIATRRIDGFGFDHGACYIPTYSECLDVIEKAGLTAAAKFSKHGAFLHGGMNQLAKKLSDGLEIRKAQRVVGLKYLEDHWLLTDEDGAAFTAKKVVLTAPVPQAMELLRSAGLSSVYDQDLGSVTYRKILVGLFIVDDEKDVERMSLHTSPSFLLMKDRGLHPRGLVIQFTDYFTEIHYDFPDEEVLASMISSAQEYTGVKFSSAQHEVKRWRYGTPKKCLPYDYIEYAPSLYLIGDSFQNPGPQGSILSAIALSRSL